MNELEQARLVGVHPHLVRVVLAAKRAGLSFRLVEGVRTKARQRALFAAGSSQILNSRHITGHAVDLYPVVNGIIETKHWPAFHTFARQFKKVAIQVQVPVQWGGDWRTFKDGPHWELPRSLYPSKWKGELL